MQKKKIEFFVSYAHSNQLLADRFIENLMEELRASKAYDYRIWMDTALIIGEDWKRQIIEARTRCSLGLLLVSPSFLGSKFIGEHELPQFVGEDRSPSIPVMLQPVNFQFQDLKGLQEQQIFRYRGPKSTEYRAYGECKPPAKRKFIAELFAAIEKKLLVLHHKPAL